MERPALADKVVGSIVGDIARDVFPPGSVLPSEAELAKREGVSRLTVREAITILKTRRVLRAEHGRGTFVNPISLWSPLDPALLEIKSRGDSGAGALPKKLIEARRLVEVGVAELAAVRRSEEDLKALERAIEGMENSGDVDSIARADVDFHKAVMAAAQNAVVAALFDPIEQLVWEARRQTTSYREMRELALEWHRKILGAIREGDAESARTIMRDHLVQTEEYLDRYLREHPKEGDQA